MSQGHRRRNKVWRFLTTIDHVYEWYDIIVLICSVQAGRSWSWYKILRGIMFSHVLYEGKNQCGCSRQLTFWYYLSVYVFAVRIILDPYFALLRASVLSDPLYVDCRAMMGTSLKLKNTSVKVLSDQLKSLCHNN